MVPMRRAYMPGITSCLPAAYLPFSTLGLGVCKLVFFLGSLATQLPVMFCFCRVPVRVQKARRGMKLFFSLSSPTSSSSSASIYIAWVIPAAATVAFL